MGLDASIYGRTAPKSVADFDREAYAVDDARSRQQFNALQALSAQAKLDEYQSATERGNKLRQFRTGLAGKTEDEFIQAHRAAGYYPEAGELEEGMLKRRKTEAEIGEKKAQAGKETALGAKAFGDAQSDALKRYRGALDFIDTPDGAARWMRAQFADPLIADHMQSLGTADEAATRIPRDPQAFAQWRQQAGMGMDRWMEQQRLAATQQETGRHNRVSETQTALRDRQTNERGVASSSAAQFVPVDGVGLFVGDKRTGTVRPVTTQDGQPVKPQKALTEGQAKANLFGSRMAEADRLINNLAAEGTSAPSIPQQLTGGQGLTGMAATAAANPQEQQVDQAQRDFINAVLRRESGAAIAASEFENARRQYFVQPGDAKQVIAQKARNRQLATQGMLAEVPEDRRMPASPAAGTKPATGFKYLGKEGG